MEQDGRSPHERPRHGLGQDERELVVVPPVVVDPVFAGMVDDAVAGVDDAMTEGLSSRPLGADPHDFAGLYIRHRSSFALHARRFLRDQRDIDEVVQEAFLRLFLALPELESELQALAYCRRTITNLCIDRYRADQRRPRLLDLDAMNEDVLGDEEDDDPVVRAEDAVVVREALALLSPLHRAALIKREIEEKPLPQIAAELDIPEESVKHVLFRARKALRRLLAGTQVAPGTDLDAVSTLELARKRAAAGGGGRLATVVLVLVASVTALPGLGTLTGSSGRSGGASDLPPGAVVVLPPGGGSALQDPPDAPTGAVAELAPPLEVTPDLSATALVNPPVQVQTPGDGSGQPTDLETTAVPVGRDGGTAGDDPGPDRTPPGTAPVPPAPAPFPADPVPPPAPPAAPVPAPAGEPVTPTRLGTSFTVLAPGDGTRRAEVLEKSREALSDGDLQSTTTFTAYTGQGELSLNQSVTLIGQDAASVDITPLALPGSVPTSSSIESVVTSVAPVVGGGTEVVVWVRIDPATGKGFRGGPGLGVERLEEAPVDPASDTSVPREVVPVEVPTPRAVPAGEQRTLTGLVLQLRLVFDVVTGDLRKEQVSLTYR